LMASTANPLYETRVKIGSLFLHLILQLTADFVFC
jgi:hypothetical protein